MSKQLLFSVTKKDLDIQPFKSSGPGGQKKNKTLSSIRMTHKDSGTTVIATKSRSQAQNIKAAWKALQGKPTFIVWLKKKAAEIDMSVSNKSPEEILEEKVNLMLKDVRIEYGPFK